MWLYRNAAVRPDLPFHGGNTGSSPVGRASKTKGFRPESALKQLEHDRRDNTTISITYRQSAFLLTVYGSPCCRYIFPL